jgi:protein-S-isoprenylcysteine O-methyltransferase Ste14
MQSGHAATVRRRVIALFFLGLLLLAILSLGLGRAFGSWGTLRFGALNGILGSAMFTGGLAIVVWSVRTLYASGTGTPAPAVPTLHLVTQGPYACSRNPMTLGALLMYLGIGIGIGSGPVIVLTVAVFAVLLLFISNHETQELAGRFGAEYMDYTQRTPFLVTCRLGRETIWTDNEGPSS